MASARTIEVTITADTTQFTAAMRHATRSVNRLGQTVWLNTTPPRWPRSGATLPFTLSIRGYHRLTDRTRKCVDRYLELHNIDKRNVRYLEFHDRYIVTEEMMRNKEGKIRAARDGKNVKIRWRTYPVLRTLPPGVKR